LQIWDTVGILVVVVVEVLVRVGFEHRKNRLDQRTDLKSGAQSGARTNSGDTMEMTEFSKDLLIVIAWQAGQLSEGQASKALKMDRIAARTLCDASITAGIAEYELRHAKQQAKTE
jgi:hypothetical protein